MQLRTKLRKHKSEVCFLTIFSFLYVESSACVLQLRDDPTILLLLQLQNYIKLLVSTTQKIESLVT